MNAGRVRARGFRGAGVLREEMGVALPLALVVVLFLAVLTAALSQMTTAETQIHERTQRDTSAQYLALAGLEHQIYVLKDNKNGAALPPVNYPTTAGQEYWYSTTLACLLQCTSTRESRRWEVTATGEVRRAGTGEVLQTRTIRAIVEIAYSGGGANLYRYPSAVSILRWEEAYP